MKKKFDLKTVYGLVLLAMLIALGIVLSAFLQFRIFSDIKIDLSYIVIVVICFLYGGIVGGISASLIAVLESILFTSYGFSISWTCANFAVGLITGLALNHNPFRNKILKYILDILAIFTSVSLGMLLIKTIIECNLYSISFNIKIVKNFVAFIADFSCMLIGYIIILPLVIKRAKGSEIGTYYDFKYDLKFLDLLKDKYNQEEVDFVNNSEENVSYNCEGKGCQRIKETLRKYGAFDNIPEFNRYKIEVLNVLGIVELDERFATYDEAEKFAQEFAKEHCSVMNIEIIDTFRENTDTKE